MQNTTERYFDLVYECENKQGRIHGNPVADGRAGAVMQKPPAIKKWTDGPTDRWTDLPGQISARPKAQFLEFEKKKKKPSPIFCTLVLKKV